MSQVPATMQVAENRAGRTRLRMASDCPRRLQAVSQYCASSANWLLMPIVHYILCVTLGTDRLGLISRSSRQGRCISSHTMQVVVRLGVARSLHDRIEQTLQVPSLLIVNNVRRVLPHTSDV